MENNKTPSIRFKGFTDPWEQRKLEDIVGIYDGVHQTPNYQNSGVMFLSVENIATLKSSKFISEEDFKRDYKVFPQENDILMTRIGDVGTTNVVTDNGLKAYYVSLALLKYKSTDPYFLSNAIQSDYVQKELANRTLKTAIPMKINKDEIGKVSVMLPLSATEQQQIGTYFRNLDDLITLHQRKYNKLLNVKKSMLEKMFPKNESNIPEIRFKGFTDPWEQRKFGDGMDLLTGYPFESKKFSDNGINLIRGMNVKRGYLDLSNSLCMKWKSSEGLEKYLLENEDILIQMDGALIGKSYAKIKETQLPALLVQRVTRARAIPEKSNSDFMYQTIQRDFLKYIILNKTDSAVPHLSLNDIREFPIRVPNLEEQKKIGEYFSNLDNLITLHQRELEKLQNIKKSMLEKMFV